MFCFFLLFAFRCNLSSARLRETVHCSFSLYSYLLPRAEMRTAHTSNCAKKKSDEWRRCDGNISLSTQICRFAERNEIDLNLAWRQIELLRHTHKTLPRATLFCCAEKIKITFNFSIINIRSRWKSVDKRCFIGIKPYRKCYRIALSQSHRIIRIINGWIWNSFLLR